MIGGNAPSVYLKKLQEHQTGERTPAELDRILESHRIDPAALRTDNFYQFFANRKKALLKLIEGVMGKTILIEENSTLIEEDEDAE